MQPIQNREISVFGLKARLLSLAFTLFGLLVLVLLPPHFSNRADIIILNLGAVLLSIGVIALAYDVYLHRAFTDELLDLVRLERNVAEAGVLEVTKDYAFDWESRLRRCSELQALVLNPASFVDRLWPHIQASASERAVRISVLLPDPAGQTIGTLASRLGTPEAVLRGNSDQARTTLKDTFAHDKAAGVLADGCSLEIRFYDFVPSYGILITEREAIAELRTAIDSAAGDRAVAISLATTKGKLANEWLSPQLRRAESALNPVAADRTP